MASVAPLPHASARLWLPRLSLAGCVRGAMLRDTRGASLQPDQRFNHYPATPLCSISWWFSGSAELLVTGHPATLDSPRQPGLPQMAFAGPQTRPTVTWCAGPAHGMMLLLLPDALHALTGIAPQAWLNRMVDVSEVLPEAWLGLCADVAGASTDEARLGRIESFLEPLWHAARPGGPLGAHRLGDWAQGLALRAATSHAGRSVRQIERRIRQWAGQPLRELQGFGRAERAFFEAMATEADSRPAWPEIAAGEGYADQSHLCRASRRITGFPPAQLHQRITSDEGFWAYRIWQ